MGSGRGLLTLIALTFIATAALAEAMRGPHPTTQEAATRHVEEAGYVLRLTFADEFDALNLRRGEAGVWTTDFGYGGVDSHTLTNNGELQLYVDPEFTGSGDHALGLQPFHVNNGVLDISADRAPEHAQRRMWNYQFYSGLLTTRHSFAQRYGYFEIRMRVPSTRGTWPAFWLLPASGEWPPEIDVMEHLGREPQVYYAGYHSNPNDQRAGGVERVEIPGPEGAFHTYSVLWDETQIRWYLDGALVRQIPTPEDMHTPMYLLINLAIGGVWAGAPTPQTRFPARMSVDYVRVYALDPAPAR